MTTETRIARRQETAPEKTHERPSVAPRVDIYENKDEILLYADMPGVNKDDVEVRLDKDRLTLHARHELGQEDGLLSREFTSVDYERSFLVPLAIDGDKITANLVHGVLRVHLPKSEAAKPRQIPVSNE